MSNLLVDYAWARPDPVRIRAAGYVGAMRYLSHDASKDITSAEAAALHAAGLSIGLVWETTAQRAGDGYNAGTQDGELALTRCDAFLEVPRDVPVFFAVDYDADPAKVEQYFEGIAARFQSHRPVGVYGSLRVVEHLLDAQLALYGWQTSAWSNGLVSAKAALYQRLRPTVAAPIPSCDENVLLLPLPFWWAEPSGGRGSDAQPTGPVANTTPGPTGSPVLSPAPVPAPVRSDLEGVPVKKTPFPGPDHFRVGAPPSDYVLALASALVLAGYGRFYRQGPSRTWGPADQAALDAFRHDHGLTGAESQGTPGAWTWHTLGLG